MKFIYSLLLILSTFSWAQIESTTTTTTIPACPVNYSFNAYYNECIPDCDEENGFLYSPERKKCEKECEAGQQRDPVTGRCETVALIDRNQNNKFVRNFHVGESCSTNTPEHRQASAQLHKDTVDIYAFENLFALSTGRDRFDLLKDLNELIDGNSSLVNKSMQKKRNRITSHFNEQLRLWRESFTNLSTAKITGKGIKRFLNKNYEEAELARRAIDPASTEQYELSIKLIEIKNGFYSQMYRFYERYYNAFEKIQKNSAGQNSNSHRFRMGSLGEAGKKCKNWGLFKSDTKVCWSHQLEVKNKPGFFDFLKEYKFLPTEKLIAETADLSGQEITAYDLIFSSSYTNFQLPEFKKHTYFYDFPLHEHNKNFTPKGWELWNENRGNKYNSFDGRSAIPTYLSGEQLAYFLNMSPKKRIRLKGTEKGLILKYLLENYDENFVKRATGPEFSSTHNTLYTYPELGIIKECVTKEKVGSEHKCYKTQQIMHNITAKTMKFFFLYSNNNKAKDLKGMFWGTLAPNNTGLSTFSNYKYLESNNRGIFFDEVANALSRARESYKLLSSSDYFNSSKACVEKFIEDLTTDTPPGGTEVSNQNPNQNPGGVNSNTENNNLNSPGILRGAINQRSGVNGRSGTFASSNSSNNSRSTNSRSAANSGKSSQQANGDNQYSIANVKSAGANSKPINNGAQSLANSGKGSNSLKSVTHSGSNNSQANAQTNNANRDSNNSYNTNRRGRSRSGRNGSNSSSGLFGGLAHASAQSAGGVRSSSRRPANTNAGLRARGLKGAHSALFKKITDVYVDSAYPTIFDN